MIDFDWKAIRKTIREQIKIYGYCYVEVKKKKTSIAMYLSGEEKPYQISGLLCDELVQKEVQNDWDHWNKCLLEYLDLPFLDVLPNSNNKITTHCYSCLVYDSVFSPFVTIDSVSQFINEINELRQGLTKTNLYYRGELAKWNPIPSLFRNKKYVINEVENDERVISSLPDEFINCKSSFDCLVKLKHYSEPSRLLDLSKSPLVALFFAIENMENNKNHDGIVRICFSKKSEEKIASISDTVLLLSGLSKTKAKKCSLVSDGKESSCIHCIDDKNNCNYVRELKYRTRRMAGFDNAIDDNDDILKNIDDCIIVHPPYNNYRIVQQQGLFIFCGRNRNNIYGCPDKILSFWSLKSGFKCIFHIPSSNMQQIREELNFLGINKYFIYGDLENEIKTLVRE